MLALTLAIFLGIASLALFLTAFFRPKLHRQDDFLWSGIGLFYALILWLCAEQLRGGVLLGQVAGVALVLTFGWQTLKLRWAVANPEAIADFESFSLLTWIQSRLTSLLPKPKAVTPVAKPETTAPSTPISEVTPVTDDTAIATPTTESEPAQKSRVTIIDKKQTPSDKSSNKPQSITAALEEVETESQPVDKEIAAIADSELEPKIVKSEEALPVDGSAEAISEAVLENQSEEISETDRGSSASVIKAEVEQATSEVIAAAQEEIQTQDSENNRENPSQPPNS
jgi:hypothetical protein